MANVTFQTSVNIYKPWGVPGDFSDTNCNHMYTLTLLAKEGDTVPITVGKFAWDNGDGTCSAVGAGVPTGLVHRELDNPIFDVTSGASMVIPASYKAPIADKCSMFVAVSDSPTVGNKLFVNNTTGAITNAAAGTTVEGATETSFEIKSLCDNTAAAGLVVIASNWSAK